jgi:type VI protein secretion system component VasK
VKPLALILAVVFFIVAILYLVGVLQVGVAHPGGRHVSHFVLFAVLGALCLVWMRFQGAPATRLR